MSTGKPFTFGVVFDFAAQASKSLSHWPLLVSSWASSARDMGELFCIFDGTPPVPFAKAARRLGFHAEPIACSLPIGWKAERKFAFGDIDVPGRLVLIDHDVTFCQKPYGLLGVPPSAIGARRAFQRRVRYEDWLAIGRALGVLPRLSAWVPIADVFRNVLKNSPLSCERFLYLNTGVIVFPENRSRELIHRWAEMQSSLRRSDIEVKLKESDQISFSLVAGKERLHLLGSPSNCVAMCIAEGLTFEEIELLHITQQLERFEQDLSLHAQHGGLSGAASSILRGFRDLSRQAAELVEALTLGEPDNTSAHSLGSAPRC